MLMLGASTDESDSIASQWRTLGSQCASPTQRSYLPYEAGESEALQPSVLDEHVVPPRVHAALADFRATWRF
jgi:hypothetical protein